MPDTSPFLTAHLSGSALARGVARHLRDLDVASLAEVTLPSGLRADVMAIGPAGEVWIVECKSSRADFRADGKWQGYLEWADRFFWAVPAKFPAEILPAGHGLIRADGYNAEIVRFPEAARLNAARRKAVTLRFARMAAARLQGISDPGVAFSG